MSADLAKIARELKIMPERVEKTVQLLDDGNTIPFITRFRKDETGGLNEKQLLVIKRSVQKTRAIEDRRTTILKSIESQAKLTDELKTDIGKADTLRQLEDLYLPFKPKKQTEAATARQQGLESLANEILEGKSPEVELAARATEYVRIDKGLSSVDDVIAGVGHIIAEGFSDNRELRAELRKIVWNTGQFCSSEIVKEKPEATSTDSNEAKEKPNTESKAKESEAKESTSETAKEETAAPTPAAETAATDKPADATVAPVVETVAEAMPTAEAKPAAETSAEAKPVAEAESKPAAETETPAPTEQSSAVAADGANVPSAPTATVAETPSEKDAAEPSAPSAVESAAAPAAAAKPKKKKKKRKKKAAPDPFKDFFDFKQSVKNIPHHRVLAINRGERAGKLNVSLSVDQAQVAAKTKQILVKEDHPFADFIQQCATNAVADAVLPGLEREVRRELTEAAERHAVEVFASNLKNLLLQPPIANRRVLAVDPGYKRGCTIAAIDESGALLESGQIFVVGNPKRRQESAERVKQFVEKHNLDVISIGNGAACRETEQMISKVLTEMMPGTKVKYIILNEAGASTYSTSEIGCEELPDLSAHERSAISIGRRLLDPLSELVKISPANIGVGMYQHDVKAKHLSESLDEVVQFCVNRVGVNVNTASPSLLKYVSGLNQLTARRMLEYRVANGSFKNRQQLKEVTGFGDATFVQAAGFLRIMDGDEPLDATSIHPESYEVARKILTKIDACPEKMFRPPAPKFVAKPAVETPTVAETPTAVETTPASVDASTPVAPVAPETSPAATEETTKASIDAEATPAVTEPVVDSPAAAEPAAETPTETSSESPAETSVEAKPAETKPAETPAEPVAAEPAATPKEEPRRSRPSRARDPEREAVLAKLKELRIDDLANEYGVGKLLIRDIVKTFSQPRRDPRDGVAKPVFRSGILKVDDLKVDMPLDAQVVNVVDFGVFVDIGLGESSLIHVSQLSNRFIRNPHQFFAIGDVVKVWVTEIDGGQRRVKLTAIKPGTPKFDKSKRSPRPSKPSHSRPRAERTKYAGKRSSTAKKPSYTKTTRRPRPPKKSPPITKEMLDGKEPMRSFSDLLQFVEKKPTDKLDKKDES